MGADCKSVGFAFEGSNPSPATSGGASRTGRPFVVRPPDRSGGDGGGADAAAGETGCPTARWCRGHLSPGAPVEGAHPLAARVAHHLAVRGLVPRPARRVLAPCTVLEPVDQRPARTAAGGAGVPADRPRRAVRASLGENPFAGVHLGAVGGDRLDPHVLRPCPGPVSY